IFAVQITPQAFPSHLYASNYSLEPSLIERFGSKGYLYFGVLYLGGILFSTLWSIYKNRDNPYYNSLGASGAVSAVIFAYLLINPMVQLTVFALPVGIRAFIDGPVLLIFEYILAKRGLTGIAHDAHITGALVGIICMGILD